MTTIYFTTEQTFAERRVYSNFTVYENLILELEITIKDSNDGSIIAFIRLENSILFFLRRVCFPLLRLQKLTEEVEQEDDETDDISERTLKFREISDYLSKKLENRPSIHHLIDKNIIQEEKDSENQINNIGIEVIDGKMDEFISQASKGLHYNSPEFCEEGVGSTYFLRNEDDQRIVAVFKPADEEDPKRNPKYRDEKNTGSPRKGIQFGEASLRECAAFKLDREGFYGVPPTYMVSCSHPSFDQKKIGSLQKFIDHESISDEVSFSTFPVNQVHKIGILDVQIMNTDRHGGNILVRTNEEGEYELVPIDHGFSLPDSLDEAWFEWLHWPQAKIPFDQSTKEYIERIDIQKDVEMLRKELSIRPECLRTMRITTTLLKKGAKAGLTLYDIASIISRKQLDCPSLLEDMCQSATQQSDGNEESFFTILNNLMDLEIFRRI